ncbi:hypothetical protein E1091_00265 [Micromonospora fluostatini]|uniref:Uncharacterized protein n=1 Tax=Micromonospora fluostatini TaxID=1629071 RepID=A0ABY2DMA1_9ACTN|nr:hypothetical protein E1091_00265 [Micromonospora fluostatini]
MRQEVAPDGHLVQMYYGEFGKGRAKIRSWKLFRNGANAGYASIASDAEVNFDRVMAGLMLNRNTGNYEPGGVIVPDNCPMCGVDLKGDGYPLGHQTDEGEICEFYLDLPFAPDED